MNIIFYSNIILITKIYHVGNLNVTFSSMLKLSLIRIKFKKYISFSSIIINLCNLCNVHKFTNK